MHNNSVIRTRIRNIIIRTDKNHNSEKWQKSHSKYSIIINAIIALGTIIALAFSIVALQITRTVNRENNIKDSTTIALLQLSVNSQIESLKETQKQFEISNAPYLQCINFSSEDIFVNIDSTQFLLDIVNLGKYPAKIIEMRVGIKVTNKEILNPINEFKQSYPLIRRVNYYVNNENSVKDFHFNEKMDWITKTQIQRKQKYLYIFGELLYINLTNNKKSKHYFSTSLDPLSGYVIMYSENVDVK